MTKKKIVSLALAAVLAVVAVTGASLAYFSDKDTAKNTFTVGNVKIDLIEQEKTANGLADFTQEKTLLPGTQTDGNALSKIVTVKNTGKNDAWVWVELLIPKYLVSSEYPTNESKNALHWNSYGCFNVEYNAGNYWNGAITDGIINNQHAVTNNEMVAVENGLWNDYKYVGTETVNNIEYVKIRTTMAKTLPAGKISLPCLRQVYMDWRVTTNEDGTRFILPAGDPIDVNASWEVLVNAYAIQANNFATVDDAIAAYANNGN